MSSVKIINKEKLNNLQIGQIFKSENQLIEYLEVSYNRNQGEKERVVDYIMEYVEYESTNNKRAKNQIEITWKANEDTIIEPMLDGRIDTLTAEVMGYMLLSNIKKFGREENHLIYFAKSYLYRECQMCNENWTEANGDKEEIKALAKELNTDIELVYEFFDITNKVFNRNIEKGCRWLKNRKLAMCSDGYAIKINGTHKRIEGEKAIILEAEYEVLKLWGMSYQEIWKKKKHRQFRNQVVKYILRKIDKYAIKNEEGFIVGYADDMNENLRNLIGLEYYYEIIEFTYNYKHIKQAHKELKTITKREASKVSNDKVKEVIDKRADKKTYRESREYKQDMNKLMKKTIKDKK